jgi:lysyl-tRNA synthetase class 2
MSISISLDALRARAILYQNFRDFFKSRQVLEVETPLLTHIETLNLNQQVSLEYFSHLPLPEMQALIDCSSGAIYQIYKQFRADPLDRRHRFEFSVLQWSQPAWSEEQVLLDLTASLQAIFSGEFEPEQRTFRQAFIQRLGFDPHELTTDELIQQAQRLGLRASLGHDRNAWLKLIFNNFIEPTLGIDIPLYLTDLSQDWRNHDQKKLQLKTYSITDIYIDGIKVGSVLKSLSNSQDSGNTSLISNFNIVFGMDRLLMIVLENRRIDSVFSTFKA